MPEVIPCMFAVPCVFSASFSNVLLASDCDTHKFFSRAGSVHFEPSEDFACETQSLPSGELHFAS